MESSRNKQEVIKSLIAKGGLANQKELLAALEREGISTTQASISRDLRKLGVTKQDGFYRLSQVSPGQSPLVDWLDISLAGEHMIVLTMGPGNASRAALCLDQAKIPGLLGTIAGDDTIFVAVADKKTQSRVVKSIVDIFSP